MVLKVIKKHKIKSILFIIPVGITVYVLFLIMSNNFKAPLKPTDKVSISSTVISDSDFLDAVKFGSANNVRNMLEVGANPNAVDQNGRNAMSIAATFRSSPELIKVLKEYKVDINHKDVNGYTPLMLAILASSSENFVNTLISYGANVNSTTNTGTSVLMMALALGNNNIKVIESLIKHGANLNYKTPHNVTPLMIALKSSNNPKLIELLLKSGAKANAKDDLGISTADILKSNHSLSNNSSLKQKIH